jgi:hypothetical protein
MQFTIDKDIDSVGEGSDDFSDLDKEENLLLGNEHNNWDAFINVVTYPKYNTSHYN